MRVRRSTSVHQENPAFHGVLATEEQIHWYSQHFVHPRKRRLPIVVVVGGFGVLYHVISMMSSSRCHVHVIIMASSSCRHHHVIVHHVTFMSSSCHYHVVSIMSLFVTPPPTPPSTRCSKARLKLRPPKVLNTDRPLKRSVSHSQT